MRLSWTQPEDLLPHGLVAAREEGRDADSIQQRWADAGGVLDAPVSGASAVAADPELRRLARELLGQLDELPLPRGLAAREPEDLDRIFAAGATGWGTEARSVPATETLRHRVQGAWLGRAAGCLLGKPVEKIPREGIRRIAQSTGNWPITSYFTAEGLDPALSAEYPWNRRSSVNSLLENIDGMPEDDDLNFPLIALGVLEKHGPEFTTDSVAQAWLDNLPGGRVFTAERITYRNLLDGYPPGEAGQVRNPFREWIGAQIRTDVYGWFLPVRPRFAAEIAWRDARLSHSRSGVYGAMFVAAAASASLTADSIHEVLEAGLSVVPRESRYAAAIRFGMELGVGELTDEAALDALHAAYGGFHWVHALNNSALLAFALARSGGQFGTAVSLAVAGGWDTDSVGATAGSLCGALAGAAGIPETWTGPLRNRLASSMPGFDGISFDELTDRVLRLQEDQQQSTGSGRSEP